MNDVEHEHKEVHEAAEAPTETPDAAEPEEVSEAELLADADPRLVSALEDARKKAREAEDKMLRAIAETENQRKRLAREQEDRIRFGNENLIRDMLSVFDSLELCLRHAGPNSDVQDVRKGVELTFSQFKQSLQNAGAEAISAEIGSEFDPKLHEAISRDEQADLPEGHIAHVVQTGFTYRQRLLRAVKVVVAGGAGRKPDA
ncbi:MAG: nucleotide exchange factor GrpE [Myxococcota bacterium]